MNAALAIATAGCLWAAPVYAQSGLDPKATVLITVSCENPKTGEIAEPTGTGFVIEQSGYILTAFHVVSCWDKETKSTFQRKGIAVRIGSPAEQPRAAQPVRTDEQADMAILKLQGVRKKYPVLRICALRNPQAGMPFLAAGFPEGSGYQPIDGRIGNLDAENGGWAAAAPFARGMSGGPVAHKGFVVGLIKGGLKDVTAVRTIMPLYRARSMIESETGRTLGECKGGQESMTDGVGAATKGGVRITDFTGTWRVRLGDDEGKLVIKQVSEGDRHFSGTLELAKGGKFLIEENKGYWDGSAIVFTARNEKNVVVDARGFYCVRKTDNGSWIIVNGDILRKSGGVPEPLQFARGSYEETCPVAADKPVAPRKGSAAFYANAVLVK